MIGTISGAKVSAVLYSFVETANVNSLKPYEYFKNMLRQIPEQGDSKTNPIWKIFFYGQR